MVGAPIGALDPSRSTPFTKHDMCAVLREPWPDVAAFREHVGGNAGSDIAPETIDLLFLFAAVHGVANRHSVTDASRKLEAMAAVLRHADAERCA